jgi:hypothetical protein
MAKPFGYVLKSQVQTNFPWMGKRWSDARNCCGDFRRLLGDAKVYKRLSSAKQFVATLDVVPVYSDPRATGNLALRPIEE